ncbi:unnamed protein product [Diplocarpon coronariae]
MAEDLPFHRLLLVTVGCTTGNGLFKRQSSQYSRRTTALLSVTDTSFKRHYMIHKPRSLGPIISRWILLACATLLRILRTPRPRATRPFHCSTEDKMRNTAIRLDHADVGPGKIRETKTAHEGTRMLEGTIPSGRYWQRREQLRAKHMSEVPRGLSKPGKGVEFSKHACQVGFQRIVVAESRREVVSHRAMRGPPTDSNAVLDIISRASV